jgi:hypothetical protein
VGVFCLVELVELQRWMSRIQLEIEGRGLDCLLLVARELGEAVRKRVGDAEFFSYAGFPGSAPLIETSSPMN